VPFPYGQKNIESDREKDQNNITHVLPRLCGESPFRIDALTKYMLRKPDQRDPNNCGTQTGSKQMAQASAKTKEESAKTNFVDITALVRSMQRTEGNFDCFRTARDYCDQVDCAWRPYCLGDNEK